MSLRIGRSPLDSSILVLLKQALCVFVQPVRKTEIPVTPNHGHESALITETALQQSLPAIPCQQQHSPSGWCSHRPPHQGRGQQPPGPGSHLQRAPHPGEGETTEPTALPNTTGAAYSLSRPACPPRAQLPSPGRDPVGYKHAHTHTHPPQASALPGPATLL